MAAAVSLAGRLADAKACFPAFVCAVMLAVAVMSPYPAWAGPDNAVSVNCSKATLKECLQKLETVGKVRIMAPESFMARNVSLIITDFSLIDAVNRIAEIAEIPNHAVSYDKSNKLIVITSVGAAAETSAAVSKEGQPASDAAKAAKPGGYGNNPTPDEMQTIVNAANAPGNKVTQYLLPDGSTVSADEMQAYKAKADVENYDQEMLLPSGEKISLRQIKSQKEKDEVSAGNKGNVFVFPDGSKMTQKELEDLQKNVPQAKLPQ